jgi:hypothetical protein
MLKNFHDSIAERYKNKSKSKSKILKHKTKSRTNRTSSVPINDEDTGISLAARLPYSKGSRVD